VRFFKLSLLIGLFTISSAFTGEKSSFEQKQKCFERVRQAYDRKEEYHLMKCRKLEIPPSFGNMFIRVFKKEEVLEVWVKKADGRYILFSEYKIYAYSGKLGPKREQGDAQVPEGFYHINDFNPYSNYHLSLGINYPNESDLKLSKAQHKGSEIYIHGGEVSAGCLAMSDYYIENIYISAVKARSQGQERIPVHIFPFRPTPINLEYYSNFTDYQQFAGLWKNLAESYFHFEKTRTLPDVMVASDGYYKFIGPAFVQTKD
jgi:murein L,D-transpeptidase YafK